MMKWITRIPTHDNEGNSLEGRVLQTLLHEVRNHFDGYSFDGPGWGAWTDEDGMVYEEHSYALTVLCERARYLDARNLVIEIGKGLGQKAMYFEAMLTAWRSLRSRRINMNKSIAARGKELLAFAEEQKRAGLNWVQANNAIYGPGGKFIQLFPLRADRTAFSGSEEDQLLTNLLASLPTPPSKELTREASGKLVVRMPKSIHQALIAEAKDEGVSLNQLILSKLSMQLKAVS